MEDVLWDFRLVENSASALGLQLNHSKICEDSITKEPMLLEVPGLLVVSRDCAELLGSSYHPLGVSLPTNHLGKTGKIPQKQHSSHIPTARLNFPLVFVKSEIRLLLCISSTQWQP